MGVIDNKSMHQLKLALTSKLSQNQLGFIGFYGHRVKYNVIDALDFEIMDVRSPEGELQSNTTLHSTLIENEIVYLLPHNMVDNIRRFFPLQRMG